MIGIILIILTLTSEALRKQFNLNGCQGFACDIPITYSRQVVVKNQDDFKLGLQFNNTLIQFANPTSLIILHQQLVIQNKENIIITGPIQLEMFGISVKNCSKIIIQNLRIFNASIDGILVFNSQNVIVRHVTIIDASRNSVQKGKCIDLTQNSTNITISESILGYSVPIQAMTKYKGLLIANFFLPPVNNISLHHNLFYCNYQRSPQISTNGLFDMKQNIIFNWTVYGSRFRNGAFGNIQGNVYIGDRKDPMVFVDEAQEIQWKNTDGFFCNSNYLKRSDSEIIELPNKITHDRYSTPKILSKNPKDTINNSGCQPASIWQTKISKYVNEFLNKSIKVNKFIG